MNAAGDPRLEGIIEVLTAIARQDFGHRADVSDALDEVDAIAVGLNMLAEELDGEVASRRELEAAYAALKDAQSKLVHSEKLAAIGHLASGVAHEINNPATWVGLGLAIVRRRTDELREILADPTLDADALRAHASTALAALETPLADAVEGISRISAVAGDLRTFARVDGDASEPLLLDDVVRAACSLARPALWPRAAIAVDLGEVPPVQGNRGRLGQVVTNLLVNAAQALPERGETQGEVRIETRVENTFAVLAVEDDGPGVPLALRERVFEPFFTTKSAEQGTGLGLSLAAEIVRQHRGTIRVLDGRRGGARFEVRLPLLMEASAVAAPGG